MLYLLFLRNKYVVVLSCCFGIHLNIYSPQCLWHVVDIIITKSHLQCGNNCLDLKMLKLFELRRIFTTFQLYLQTYSSTSYSQNQIQFVCFFSILLVHYQFGFLSLVICIESFKMRIRS